jgi:pleckstrin domain-containing family G protein 5
MMRQQVEHERLSNIIDRIEAYDAIEAPNDECMKVISEYTKVETLLTCQLPGCGAQEYRNLLREGGLKLKEPYSRMDVHCFLFTDMLLITKPSRRGDKVKVIKPPMRLDKIMVHPLRDGGQYSFLYSIMHDS